MTEAETWRRLGIVPTTDIASIRRAYAAALKTIDPDTDPDAFSALRTAREQATFLAQQTVAAEQVQSSVETDEVAQVRQVPEPEQSVAEIALVAHQRALITMLLPGEDAQSLPLDFEEAEAVLSHFDALTQDPRLDEIEIFGDAMEWFARLIAEASPRSDTLIEPATEFFGWSNESTIHHSPAIEFVIARRRAIDFSIALASRDHPLHRAWNELRRPATESSRRGRVGRNKINALLETVRSDYPTLEKEFDWYRVQIWENRSSRWTPKIGSIVIGVWLLVQLLRAIPEQAPSPTPPPTFQETFQDAELESASDDIGMALKSALGADFSGPLLMQRGSGLHADLVKAWRNAYDAGQTRSEFFQRVRDILEARAGFAIAEAPAEIQTRAVRLRLEQAELAKASGWPACAGFFDSKPVRPTMPEAW